MPASICEFMCLWDVSIPGAFGEMLWGEELARSSRSALRPSGSCSKSSAMSGNSVRLWQIRQGKRESMKNKKKKIGIFLLLDASLAPLLATPYSEPPYTRLSFKRLWKIRQTSIADGIADQIRKTPFPSDSYHCGGSLVCKYCCLWDFLKCGTKPKGGI